MKVSKDFDLVEFVDPVTYKIRGEKSIELIDNRLINLVQFFRDYFDTPVTVNNWADGGQYQDSGLRTFLSKTGATYSQHKFGRAADLKFKGITAEHVRADIRKYWSTFQKAGLTTIEMNTPTWVHIAVSFTGLPTLIELPYK